MSFRRSKDAAAEKQRWKTFVATHRGALNEIGMPEQLFRDKSAFDYWLMHGYHPGDPSGFSIEHVQGAERAILVDLVSDYIGAGFGDPGISILSNAELQRIAAAVAKRRR